MRAKAEVGHNETIGILALLSTYSEFVGNPCRSYTRCYRCDMTQIVFQVRSTVETFLNVQ